MANVNGIAIPDDTLWIDRDLHTPNSHTKKETASGRLQITTHTSQKGRPITLDLGLGVPELGAKAPTFLMVKQFQALRDADATMSCITADGTIFNTVKFDHEAGHVEATPVIDYAVPEDGDFYYLTLHLYEI